IADLAMQADALTQDKAREDTLAVDAAAALERLTEEEQQLARSLAAGEAQKAALDGAVVDAERAARDADVASAQALARAAAEQADTRIAETALAGARQRRARADAEIARLDRELAAIGEEAPLAAALEAAREVHSEAETRLGSLTES